MPTDADWGGDAILVGNANENVRRRAAGSVGEGEYILDEFGLGQRGRARSEHLLLEVQHLALGLRQQPPKVGSVEAWLAGWAGGCASRIRCGTARS